jgi:hypothetical protein
VRFQSKVASTWTKGGEPGQVRLDWWGPNATEPLRARFTVEIYGEHLWGPHQVDFGGDIDLQFAFDFTQYILQGENRYAADRNPLEVRGLAGQGWLFAHATPGAKQLCVNGESIPFELIVEGYPGREPVVKRLDFVRKIGDDFQPVTGQVLRPLEDYYIEVEFSSIPEDITVYDVPLERGEAQEIVQVHKQGNTSTFRSEVRRAGQALGLPQP